MKKKDEKVFKLAGLMIFFFYSLFFLIVAFAIGFIIFIENDYTKEKGYSERQIKKEMKEISKLLDPNGSEVLKYKMTKNTISNSGERTMYLKSSKGEEYKIFVGNKDMGNYDTDYFDYEFMEKEEKELIEKYGFNVEEFKKENDIKNTDEKKFDFYNNFYFDTRKLTTYMFENKLTYEELKTNKTKEFIKVMSNENPGIYVHWDVERKNDSYEKEVLYLLYSKARELNMENSNLFIYNSVAGKDGSHNVYIDFSKLDKKEKLEKSEFLKLIKENFEKED